MVKLFKYKISTLEIILFIVLIFYLVFNVQTPHFFTGIIDSPLGIIILMVFVLMLFLYVNPILGVLGLFVAYEMIRRTTLNISGNVPMMKYTPTQIHKERQMVKMNLPNAFELPLNKQETFENIVNSDSKKTLEEEIVNSMAPIGVNEAVGYIDSSFKPVMESSHNASNA